MTERTALTAQKPEAKMESPISRIQEPELSQFASSPIDRIMFLQRTIGNQAVNRLLKSHVIQAKLKVSEPGDKYEQEADRIAEQIVASTPQHKCTGKCSEDEEKKLIQRKTAGTSDTANTHVADSFVSNLGPGMPLDTATRAFFEPRFGHDFSGVRVHKDAKAAEMARAVNARAFTVGRDIVFDDEQCKLGADYTCRLVAHELTHVIQQDKKNNLIQRKVKKPVDEASFDDVRRELRMRRERTPSKSGNIEFPEEYQKFIGRIEEVASQRLANDEKFLKAYENAKKNNDWKLPGTLFHSKAKQVGLELKPEFEKMFPGKEINFEVSIAGGNSRLDIRIDDGDTVYECDFKTTINSGTSRKAADIEMPKHRDDIKIDKPNVKKIVQIAREWKKAVDAALLKKIQPLVPAQPKPAKPAKPSAKPTKPKASKPAQRTKPAPPKPTPSSQSVPPKPAPPAQGTQQPAPPKPAPPAQGTQQPAPPKPTPPAQRTKSAQRTKPSRPASASIIGGGAMILHSGLIQLLNEQQAEKAEAEFERLKPEIESLRSKGEWVQVFIVYDVPEKFNMLESINGPVELTEIAFFKRLYIKSGRTLEEAINPPTTIGPLLAETIIRSEPLDKPEKGRKWVDYEYTKPLPPTELREPTPLKGFEIAGNYESEGTKRKLRISLSSGEDIKIESWNSADGEEYTVRSYKWEVERGRIEIVFFKQSKGCTIRSVITYLGPGQLLESYEGGCEPNLKDHGNLLWTSPKSMLYFSSPLLGL